MRGALTPLSGSHMSTELACFLFGIPASFLWVRAVRRGVIFGSRTHWLRRDEDPLLFWFFSILYGSMALGLLITPVLVWLKLRD